MSDCNCDGCDCDCDGCCNCCDSPDSALPCALCCNLCLSGTMVDAAETVEYAVAASRTTHKNHKHLKYSHNENGSAVITPVTPNDKDEQQPMPVLIQPQSQTSMETAWDGVEKTTSSPVCNSDIELTVVDNKSAANTNTIT